MIIDEQPNERRIGVIRSLGGLKTSNQGTHLLQLDDGDTVLLKSLAINLDDPMYSGKMVEVRGAITYTTDNKQLMEVLNIDIVQDTPTQEMKELSWQTYDNASMGFSIKYRSDMKVSASDDSVDFEKKVEDSAEVSASGSEEVVGTQETAKSHLFRVTAVDAGSKTYLEWLKSEFPTLKSDSSGDLLVAGLTKSKVGVSSLDSVKHTDGSVVDYYVSGDKSFYVIHIDSGNDSSSLQDQNIFYEMLGSFTAGNPSSVTQELVEVDVESTSTTSDTATTKPAPTSTASDEDDEKPTSTTSGSTTTTSTSGSTSSGGTSTPAPTPVAPPPTAPASTSGSSTTSTTSTTDTSDVAISGFTKLESETFNFSMQFPKSWYYSGTTPTESGVVRHYDFGDKPLDEEEGSVSLDVISGSAPSGTAVTVNGKDLIKVTSGDEVQYYYEGEGSRVYRVTGPASSASTLATMASSVEE